MNNLQLTILTLALATIAILLALAVGIDIGREECREQDEQRKDTLDYCKEFTDWQECVDYIGPPICKGDNCP